MKSWVLRAVPVAVAVAVGDAVAVNVAVLVGVEVAVGDDREGQRWSAGLGYRF